jgi:hypothetical protein
MSQTHYLPLMIEGLPKSTDILTWNSAEFEFVHGRSDSVLYESESRIMSCFPTENRS